MLTTSKRIDAMREGYERYVQRQRNRFIHTPVSHLACEVLRKENALASQARRLIQLLLMLALVTGCGSAGGGWSGPARGAGVTVEPWATREPPAAVLRSAHYTIYSTLPPGNRRSALPQVLEGAYAQYQAVAPASSHDTRPMHGYVFAERAEWEQFTRFKTGNDARMYLKIPRGGYTLEDWFAVYSDSDSAVFSALAHEGWHQYAARHFKRRLPPFLEEGIACLFENVRLVQGLPRWDTSSNPTRARALAAARGKLWPLGTLITLHAGNVVDLTQAEIDGFYAQNWAFARFLLEANGERYRPMLRALLAVAADGTLREPDGAVPASREHWNSDGARALLEHYLRQDFPSIERAYAAFCAQVAEKSER